MWLNMFILASEIITKDGGLSADYTFTVIIGALGSLLTIGIGIFLNTINNNITSIRNDIKDFKDEFHDFVEDQKGLNATFHERTKHL